MPNLLRLESVCEVAQPRPQARILHTMPTYCGCSRAVGQSDKWDSGADGNEAEEEGDSATVGQWYSGAEVSWEEEQRGS